MRKIIGLGLGTINKGSDFNRPDVVYEGSKEFSDIARILKNNGEDINSIAVEVEYGSEEYYRALGMNRKLNLEWVRESDSTEYIRTLFGGRLEQEEAELLVKSLKNYFENMSGEGTEIEGLRSLLKKLNILK